MAPGNDPVLPQGVRGLLHRTPAAQRHPGLQLDKYSPPGEQKTQSEALDLVCLASGDDGLLQGARGRRHRMFEELGARTLRAHTLGPLTLHLARAGALENAGIHLHPLYGFCCLPGSGLKGMVRAWAETTWIVDQDDAPAAKARVDRALGRAGPTSTHNTGDTPGAHAGAVVFHDAWPAKWPRLERDIANSHNRPYYEGRDDPGDWHEPNLASFLAVAPGEEFDFALSLRSPDGDPELLELALEWLAGALTHEGAGAKTNAGYGRFDVSRSRPEPAPPKRARRIANHTLQLATPAFLAGARQERDDCVLRPATLRGLLRWWWRTMHAAHLGRQELLELEGAIWGAADHGAALALSVRAVAQGASAPQPERFAHKRGQRIDQTFAHQHGIEPNRQPKTVQGLFYASYGMDETNRQRWYMPPGASWRLTFSARNGFLKADRTMGRTSNHLTAEQALRQAEAALWLLCRYGAVGSKARKGFGSLDDLKVGWIESRRTCIGEAAKLRAGLGLASRGSVDSPKLEEMVGCEKATVWLDPWFVMDQVGGIQQDLVKSTAKENRAALGLPRRGSRAPEIKRHASPMHWSLSTCADGAFKVRLSAFPAPRLPSAAVSREVLGQAVARAKKQLDARGSKQQARRAPAPSGRRRRQDPSPAPSFHAPPAASRAGLPRPGETVEVVMLAKKTKKGGWRFRHEPSGLEGHIVNSAMAPAEVEADQRLQVRVAFANDQAMAANWPNSSASTPSEPGRTGGPGRETRRGGSRRKGGQR